MADKKKIPNKSKTLKTTKPTLPKNKFSIGLFAVGEYFKGSWAELKKVRWPNRRSAWGMTAAVLLFTGMFVLIIVSLDAIFTELFNLIIK